MRLLCCRFAALLPILTLMLGLAHAQGTTPSQAYLLPTVNSGDASGFTVNVRPGASAHAPFTAPTGTVTLYSGATAIGSPAMLSAGSGFTSATFAQVLGTPDPSLPASTSAAAWGDFNEDGIPDLLVYGPPPPIGQSLAVQVFAGKAADLQDVTLPVFTPLPAQQLALYLQTQSGQSVAVLDVDGDGHLDLLAGNTVAYGKGDGTFGQVAVLPAVASGYNQTYSVDIDGDGKLDIVAVDTPPSTQAAGTVQYAFTVFHNDGGGSFSKLGPYPLAPSFAGGSSLYNIFGLSFADLNGDGRVDVLSQSNMVPVGTEEQSARLNVMLNLGTGFSSPTAIDTSTILDESMVSISFADLNNDGKQDLVFSFQANTMNNGVATLLGNGDGTFAAPVNFTIGSTLYFGTPLLPLIMQDVNGDGNADVVLGSGVLLLGNGDGTLAAGTPLFAGPASPLTPPPEYNLLAMPQGDTVPGGEVAPLFALLYVNLQPGENAAFLPNVGSNAAVTPMLGPGTYSLTAHYAGDATYAASVSNALTVTIPPTAPMVAVTSSANPSYTGENVTLTATITGAFNPSGSVVFSDGATALGTVAVSSGAASYTGSFSSTGSHTITAAYSGDANNAAASGTLAQTVDAPFSIGATSGASTALSVTSGQSVTAQVSVVGMAGFSGTVNFSCTGLPTNAACSFSPASMALSGATAVSTTLTVSTGAAATASADDESPLRATTALACGLPLLGLLTLLPVGRGRRLLLCLGFMLFAGASGLMGCGGGNSAQSSATKTKPGSYTFQVVGTSGTASSTASYTLTVQ